MILTCRSAGQPCSTGYHRLDASERAFSEPWGPYTIVPLRKRRSALWRSLCILSVRRILGSRLYIAVSAT